MKRDDLRDRIIPKTIENTDEYQDTGSTEFDTKDLIYLDSHDEQFDGKNTNKDRKIFATDYAIMNNVYMYIYNIQSTETGNGRGTVDLWLRDADDEYYINSINGYGEDTWEDANNRNIGLCPSLHYKIQSDMVKQGFWTHKQTKNKNEQFDIREVKDIKGKTIYHTLQIGEYPKTKVDEKLSMVLESLYNEGKIKEGITCTGRWYSSNGQKEDLKDYAGKHSPEFEYEGDRYVRVVSYPNRSEYRYSDGTSAGRVGIVRWVKVEPISFKIINWKEMPKSINPKGNGRARYFDLRAEEAITSNIPFYPNDNDGNITMWQNSTIRGFFNGIDVRNIQSNGNAEYGASHGGNFTGECNFLNEAFNLSRQPMIEYTIPDSETEIPDDAFNGCISLKKLIIHANIKSVGERAFDGLNFKYAYRTETGELIFSQELPKNKEEYKRIIELSKMKKCFGKIDYSLLVQNKKKIDDIDKLLETLNKNKFKIPYIYGAELIKNGNIRKFYENSDFRFFRSEIPDINDKLLDFPEGERLSFFKFATALGCFSAEKIKNKKGKETEVILAQKAASLLSTLLKTDKMKLGKYYELFELMPLDSVPNQEFLKFISEEKVKKEKDENGNTISKESKLENLELILNLEKDYPGIFVKAMTNFDGVKSLRVTLNENGKPIRVPWEEALKKFYSKNKYIGITEENKDIAELFMGKDLSQETFDKANMLRKEAKSLNVPEHILGKQIREETILDSIERIKNQTEEELINGKQMIEELYDKQFTYEWLSKNDPHNSIMGLFCSCCGTITSGFYGKDIAKSSVIAPDVQNIVIRDSKGDIISKGTMYVNKDKGYGVINDFELNEKYRNHERCEAGEYNVEETDKEEQERELIFKAFQRGLKVFAEEYDKQNPDKPLQQINIGMGYNRLKRQVKRFKEETSDLTVPDEYCFEDAEEGQYILYQRLEQEIENGGYDR